MAKSYYEVGLEKGYRKVSFTFRPWQRESMVNFMTTALEHFEPNEDDDSLLVTLERKVDEDE